MTASSSRRKVLAAAAAGSLLALTLGACSNSDSSSRGGPVTLHWATVGSPASLAAEQKVIDAFEKANPAIKVQLDSYNFDTYETKLVTAFRAGLGPDAIRIIDTDIQAWGQAGYLADLSDVANEPSLKQNQYVPSLMDVGHVGDKQFALPLDTGNRVLFYNPTLFAKVGITSPPATWDELVADVKKFKGTGDYGYAFRSDNDYSMSDETVGPFINTAGGQVLSTDGTAKAVAGTDPKTVAAVQLLQDIVNTGAVPPGESNMSYETLNSLFTGGKVAMMMAGPWVRDAILAANPKAVYGKDYATAVTPAQTAGGPSGSAGGGWQIAANAKSKHLDATKKLIAFFEQHDNLISVAKVASFPPLLDGLDIEPFSSDPFYTPFKDVLAHTASGIPRVPEVNQVSSVFQKDVLAAVTENKSPAQQLLAFDGEVNKTVLK